MGIGGYAYWQSHKLKLALEKREQETNRRMYELAILKELGERVGYSLDMRQIADVITGSLHQFIEYSAVSYMLLGGEKIVFHIHLEKSVHRGFIDEVRNRMLQSLSALLDKQFKQDQVDELLSGAILIEDVEEPVGSFFNIPLVIGEKVVGVLTVAHTQAGLYKEEELTILYKIINQASQAVTRLQDVVKMEQSKLNAMVESMADGVVMTDTDYRIMVVNPAAKKAIGIEEKKEIDIFDFIDKLGGRFDIKGRLEESMKLSKPYASDRILLGDKFYQFFVFPVRSSMALSEGKVLGGVVIFHDVTKEMEVEKLRDDFTHMIVHELRSPLDSIRKISEVLREGSMKANAKGSKEYLQMIYQNSSGMLELVNNILDLAKLDAGKFEIRREPSNIKDIVKNRVDFFDLYAKDVKVKLHAIFDKQLPTVADFDPAGIKQVLNNLISNAVKFTRSGGIVNITVFQHKVGNKINEEFQALSGEAPVLLSENGFKDAPSSLVIAVSDSGIGIPKDGIGQLFNKFKQLGGNLVGAKKGTGLGLAIAKGIVEGHGGAIGAVSEEGVGSTFYFMLPLAQSNRPVA
ncbi:MAG: Response regulator receiver modulated diguanylate cyclase with sensor [Parcubacteria group bacterium]|nr:Response regulator receiver modulated diguanylate cyclase with sensor [Parcubacteria group bacterium]